MNEDFDTFDPYSKPVPGLKFAEDFNDPSLDVVLTWHEFLCPKCYAAMNPKTPLTFGQSMGDRFCPERLEIITEYAEYEGHYAMRGNP